MPLLPTAATTTGGPGKGEAGGHAGGGMAAAVPRGYRGAQAATTAYGDLLNACMEAGAARTHAEAEALTRAMDDIGVVLLFQDKAYLHPKKVAFLSYHIILVLHIVSFLICSIYSLLPKHH